MYAALTNWFGIRRSDIEECKPRPVFKDSSFREKEKFDNAQLFLHQEEKKRRERRGEFIPTAVFSWDAVTSLTSQGWQDWGGAARQGACSYLSIHHPLLIFEERAESEEGNRHLHRSSLLNCGEDRRELVAAANLHHPSIIIDVSSQSASLSNQKQLSYSSAQH
jgi:hypothetical protein